VYDTQISSEEQKNRMQSALHSQQHRGPDDEGLWQEKGICLGHRRLSIIDQAGSRQPMCSPDGRYILSFNGEIYNYQDLRPALAAHWPFQTKGDTEVLLAGLLIQGKDFIDRMEGMWAFALWDHQEQRLLLCRDRMGKKPLYYQEQGASFFCASELPALKCLTSSPWTEDLDSSADFFRHGYYLPGSTAYQEVREVLPGHLLTWSPGQPKVSQPYWSLGIRPFTGTKEEAVPELRRILIQAVQRRMVADVEVGAFLSGGIDSSLVVAIMTSELGVRPKTFTIGFQEPSYDERKFAEQVARQQGTDHYSQVLSTWDRDALTRLILKNVGQPFADASILPTTLVSQLAASKVKVVLSGDGGDELFSGYQRYQARVLFHWYFRLPKALQAAAARLIQALPEPMSHHSHSLVKKAHLFQDIANRIEEETPYFAPVMYPHSQYRRLFPSLIQRGQPRPLIAGYSDEIQRMMLADALIYLPQDILIKVDRASMSCSLEARAPFLDRNLVEFAFSLPRSWHRSGFSGKKMLKLACADILAPTIWKRRKQGFGVPIHDWFRQDLGREFEALLAQDCGPIEPKEVRLLLEQHRQGQRDHGYRLWSLYVYLLWRSQGRA
jgi:asparagine synthase (glutamine-hydrolysing)